METLVNEDIKTIYFRGKYPQVESIPQYMKNYPEYTPCVVDSFYFDQLKHEGPKQHRPVRIR